MADAFPPSLTYKQLKTRHECYTPDFWQTCKALYSGGQLLLGNPLLLKRVMPPHANEHKDIYEERLRRAFYIPYAGSIIDKLVAELMAKPLTLSLEDTTASPVDGGTAGASDVQDTPLPDYYRDLQKNTAPIGAPKASLAQFLRDQIFTALKCRTAWSLVELPKAPELGYANFAAQVEAGGLNAYMCPIDPECVIDWEEQDDGELAWALIQDTLARRQNIQGNRNMITIRWRYYRPADWAIYELQYDKTKKLAPSDVDLATLVSSGTHSFGRVPLRRLTLPDGLWAMGKLEGIARAHMNQRCALSWGQLKALFPVPIMYAQAPDSRNPVSEDENRVNQQAGQGYLRVFAEKDRIEYLSPDTSPYTIAEKDLATLRDEMYRVLYSMAQSVDNSGAALKRSGESKAIDQAAAAVILRALGTYAREHVEDILNTISTGRKDNLSFCASGMDMFDETTLSQLILDGIGLESISIPSATFNQLFKMKIVKLALGADVKEDDILQIQKDLQTNVSQDTFEVQAAASTASHEAKLATAQATIDDPTGGQLKKVTGGFRAPK